MMKPTAAVRDSKMGVCMSRDYERIDLGGLL